MSAKPTDDDDTKRNLLLQARDLRHQDQQARDEAALSVAEANLRLPSLRLLRQVTPLREGPQPCSADVYRDPIAGA